MLKIHPSRNRKENIKTNANPNYQNHPEGYKTFVHRVNYCLRCRIDSQKGVGVRINEERGTAHYDNLQRCGSVWTCAPCSGEITEVRKVELKQGIDNWRKKSGHVYLVTLTNRHHFVMIWNIYSRVKGTL